MSNRPIWTSDFVETASSPHGDSEMKSVDSTAREGSFPGQLLVFDLVCNIRKEELLWFSY